MADVESREKIMILTDTYRILGEMRRGPDGSIWDFKHRAAEDFVTVYQAQCFRLIDGKRMYDAAQMDLSRRAVVALFLQEDVAFVRKDLS